MATTEGSVSNGAVRLEYWPRGASIRRPASWLDWAYLALTMLCLAVAVAGVAVAPHSDHWSYEWELSNHIGQFADGLGLTLFALGLAEVLWVGSKRCAGVILAGTWVSGLSLAFLLVSGAAFPRNNYA